MNVQRLKALFSFLYGSCARRDYHLAVYIVLAARYFVLQCFELVFQCVV